MARKYKRSSNGRFAGGGGGPTSAGGGGRKIAKNGSKGVKAAKPKLTAGARFKKGAKATGKFIKKNPDLVISAVGLAATVAAGQTMKAGVRKHGRLIDDAGRHARNTVSNKRGIGGLPGANLKAARRGARGAYKIRSGR